MKILKRILIGLAILIGIALIVALFVPKDYSVSRSVTINEQKSEVFNYLKYLKNQNEFSVWAQIDPDMKQTFSGTDGTVGFVSAWESENGDAGKGEQEIMKITEGERIDYEIRFKEPFESTGQAHISTEATAPGQTKVTWVFEGHMPYPMNIMQVFMKMDDALGPDLQKGLDNLKQVRENG